MPAEDQTSAFSHKTRAAFLKRLESEEFDVLIVGGGINGAGIARDAASRGMKVALIEADDFASGTSSRSSKLIHGGIRYLENLEFGLVFEALSERRILFEMAPHLVHPLRFFLPLYRGGRVGMLQLGLGMWLYDALSLFEAPQMHERLSRKKAIERFPQLEAEGLLGGYSYSDGYMDDDRLVIETLRAAHVQGAVSVNYVKAVGGELENSQTQSAQLKKVRVRDEKSGREFFIKAKHFISTVGPWTDLVAPKLLPDKNAPWSKKMRPTKGVHLTFSRERVPLPEALVMISKDEKRIVFAIPRHEMVIIGTTDTDFPADPSLVHTEKRDVEYLLGVAQEYFPHLSLTQKDILSSYSGVRPLVDDQSESESKTSREHMIMKDSRNVTFVMGGKYTTYRLIAEQATEAALEFFSSDEQLRFSRSETKSALNPLVTKDKMERALRRSSSLAEELKCDESVLVPLIERHGEEALEIVNKYLTEALKYIQSVELSGAHEANSQKSLLWALEALHAIDQTMCMGLKDFYLRRSALFLSHADHGKKYLNILAAIFSDRLGLSQNSLIEELSLHSQHELGWKTNLN